MLPAKLGNNLTCTHPVTGKYFTFAGEHDHFAVKGGAPWTGCVFQAFEQIQAAVAAGGVWVWQEAVRVDPWRAIQSFDLQAGQSVMVQRDSFICAQSSATVNIAFVKKLGSGFFGGEGFILEKITGPGIAFIHAGGDFMEFTLAPGEVLQVDTGCIVAFDEGVDYDIQFVGGIKTAIFGGEGLFLATLRGPGRVIVQSMTLEKMRRELAPGRSGGDEKNPLGALSGLLNSED